MERGASVYDRGVGQRDETPSELPLVLQWVRLHWTKRSRGGEGATRRAHAPTAFDVSEPAPHDPSLAIFERIDVEEGNDWVPVRTATRESVAALLGEAAPKEPGPYRKISARSSLNFRGELRLELDGDGLAIHLQPNTFTMPHREPMHVFTVQPGQWARVVFNERYDDESIGWKSNTFWTYVQSTFSIAWRLPFRPGRFRLERPDLVFDRRAHLR